MKASPKQTHRIRWKRRPAISDHDDHLVSQIPTWVEATKDTEILTGLSVDEMLRRALQLRDRFRAGTASPTESTVDAESVETFHALCTLLDQPGNAGPKALLPDAAAAFEFILGLDWPNGEFGGREVLLSRLAFLCWRNAREAEDPAAEFHWIRVHASIKEVALRSTAEKSLAPLTSEHAAEREQLGLEDPELLLCLCETLRSRGEAIPLVVRDEAAFFFAFLEKPFRSIGSFDEREYFLGEFALIAGVACRFLFRRQEAKVWFARSEANFVMAHNSPANVARLAYQRLALKVEEREFNEVVELGPVWAENFGRLGLAEESLKCRFLEGAAYRELGRIGEAIEVFKSIYAQAEAESNLRLLAQAANGLAQFYRVTGDLKEALAYAKNALPLLEKLDNRVNLAKLRWCVGDIFREQGRSADALVSYRAALIEAEAIGIRGDVAALHLVVADLLLDAGQDAQAEWEVRAALPIIEEEKMVPEGMAALTLLRESLRRRQINRQALRDLHGYFQDNG